MEGLGEAFAILTGVADAERARQILSRTPTTAWGFPCLWPQFEEWRDYKRDFAHYYHNGMIWPFVQGYWAWAATEMKDAPVFGRELDALVKLSREERHLHGALPPGRRQAGRLAAPAVERFGLSFHDISRPVRHGLCRGRSAVSRR